MMYWLGVYALELLFYYTPLWRLRRVMAPVLVVAILCSLAYTLGSGTHSLYYAVPLLILAPFRIINFARVMKARMQPDYLRKVTKRSALFFLFYHSLALMMVYVIIRQPLHNGLTLFFAVQVLLSLIILAVVLLNIQRLSFKMPKTFVPDKDLPTVTIAIPARNETQDLEECLRTVIANDYPKMEIIVYDDCSQNQRTADIIKSFAQDGVRFIGGEEPHDRWLAKNQAYQKLYNESTGELLLFCGVDVRFGPSTIRAMVNLLHSRNKQMLSVLPLRVAGEAAHTFFQPMRYWWELAIPRRIFNKPAVLSTCWMINRQSLKKLGGFASVSHSIAPEGLFARELVKLDAYSFVRSSEELEVRTVKGLDEQRATTLRVRYPQIRRRLETLIVITLIQIAVFVLPLASIGLMMAINRTGLILLPVISLLAILIAHLAVIQVTNPGSVAISILTFPIAVIMELIVGYISMYNYEFGSVEWKSRNICIPVMHTYPRLPKV